MSDIFILYVAFSYLYVAFSVFKIRDKIKIKHFIVLFLPAPMTLPWVLVTEYKAIKKADKMERVLSKVLGFKRK